MPYSKRKLKPVTIAPDKDRRIRAILLTCRPGSNPVPIPVKTPKTQKRITRTRGSKSITPDLKERYYVSHHKFLIYT